MAPVLDEVSRKLLRSAASALPLTEDPWRDLARGLFIEREELAARVEALVAIGVIEGVWGEPNPAHPGSPGALLHGAEAPPAGAAIRWSARTTAGERIAAVTVPTTASPRAQWFKAGLPIRFDEAAREPLSPSRDRTLLTQQITDAAPLDDGSRAFLALLATPQRVRIAANLWEELAAACPRASAPRDVVRRLLLDGRIRRLALRVNPVAAGWGEGALADWSFDDAASAIKAAEALAAVAATGDVWIEEGTNLRALFVDQSEDGAAAAVESVSARWGLLPLSCFRIHFD